MQKFRRSKSPREAYGAIDRSLTSIAGAIDLASIMVGVLVIGIIGGVIAATVFAVIPWAQDRGSEADLASVKTAESVAKVKDSGYMSLDVLPYLEKSDRVRVVAAADGSCFVAVGKSPTGRFIFLTNDMPSPQVYVAGTVTSCESQVKLADVVAQFPSNGAPANVGPVAAGQIAVHANFFAGGETDTQATPWNQSQTTLRTYTSSENAWAAWMVANGKVTPVSNFAEAQPNFSTSDNDQTYAGYTAYSVPIVRTQVLSTTDSTSYEYPAGESRLTILVSNDGQTLGGFDDSEKAVSHTWPTRPSYTLYTLANGQLIRFD